MSAKRGDQDVDQFVADLGTSYEAYARNTTREKNTGVELVIPVSENAKFREDLQRTIDELCAVYLTLSDQERDHVRKLVQAYPSLHNGLLAHIGWTAQHKPPNWLLRGLAAASIEDNRTDYRDMFVALGDLYLEAARNAIDVSSCFREAAMLSNPISGPYSKVSMREFLAGFEQSAYFEQSIASKLQSKSG